MPLRSWQQLIESRNTDMKKIKVKEYQDELNNSDSYSTPHTTDIPESIGKGKT